MTSLANGLTIHPATKLHGEVVLEPPFRTWACTLNKFSGGAFGYVSPASALHRVSLGRYCSVGDNVVILSQHPANALTASPFAYQALFAAPFDVPAQFTYSNLQDTCIGNDVWIGAGVKIKTGVVIGDGAIIAAGSVVTRDVAPFAVMGGVPARLIRMRFAPPVLDLIERLQWWRYNLLGLSLDLESPEAALLQIEDQIASGQLKPYAPGFYRLWHEADKIVARLTE